MRKLVAFMHVSLDGFVAGPKGEMNWIKVDEELFDYVGLRTKKAGTALYGRVTYDMMDAYWPTAADKPNPSKHDIEHSAWYKSVEKVVVSRTMKDTGKPNTRIIGNDLEAEIMQLKQDGDKEIIIFGSPSITQQLAYKGLIDDYWLFVNPILIGEGIPLFKGVENHTKLKMVKTHTLASGVVFLQYEK